MEFIDVVKNRFAARNFKSDKIDKSILMDILRVGILAPTAKNLQPEKLIVVESDDALKLIDDATPCRYNAPVVVIVASDKNIAFNNNGDTTLEMDASIVATHIVLAATNYGVNSTWIKLFDKDKIKNDFKLEETQEPICLINLGYKTDECVPGPQHSLRKSPEEIIEFI